MREIILDTETTGLDPATGDRLVEIAGVEVLNYIPTGEFYHTYLDPERDVPEGAFRVHGLSTEFLKGKPLFRDVAAEFLAFIGDSRLVIHNAEFDMKFLNAEYSALRNFMSNSALWITSRESPMKARNSAATSRNRGFPLRNSVESP